MNRRAWLLGALVALSPAVSQAAALMLVDGVIGPAKLPGYAGWFHLEAFSWSIDRSKTSEPHGFNVVLVASATTAALVQASASGAMAKKIVVDQVFMADGSALQLRSRLACEEPFIRASSVSADADDSARMSFKIQCGRLAWEYFDYNDNKSLAATGKGSWNFKTNTP